MERDFITADIYLISAIKILLHIEPQYKVQGNRTLGVFPASDALYKALNDFNNGVPINALEFSQVIKKVRSELITRRNQDAEGGIR